MLHFKGGIHPLTRQQEKSITWRDSTIEIMPAPEKVYISLAQHIGKPAKPVVEKGQYVKVGELIAAADGFISANIHSSVSGKVLEIGFNNNFAGVPVPTIIIDNDNVYDAAEKHPIENPTPQDIVHAAAEMGLAGMGGATFPTHVKLAPKEKIDFLIINGAECEPFITADNRLMTENAADIIKGVRLSQLAVSAPQVIIGIEANKPTAIKAMTEATAPYSDITVKVLPKRYPMGAEKQLIYHLTKRMVPSGALPSAVGCVVQNVSTANALYEAVCLGSPVTGRVTTVGGSATGTGKNLYIPIGTRICDVLDYLSIDMYKIGKILSGGPMMGIAVSDVTAAVTKGTSALLLLNQEDAKLPEETACIRCGRCATACPMGLTPMMIDANQRKGNIDECVKLHAADCIECGSCTFVCPAKRYLMQSIRLAKAGAIKKAKEKKQ